MNTKQTPTQSGPQPSFTYYFVYSSNEIVVVIKLSVALEVLSRKWTWSTRFRPIAQV